MNYQNREWLVKRYLEENLYITDIAHECGVSRACIVKWIRKFNLPRKPQPRRFGVLNPHWKGGSYLSSQGYRFVMRKDHPRAINGGYVPEQVVVVEDFIGRPLMKDEVVHHIDSDKLNNEISNLYLFTKREHDDYHRMRRWNKVPQITTSNLSMNG